MQLKDDGQPLRNAFNRSGLSIQELADKTRSIDGYGVSKSTIGHLLSTGTFRRRTCQRRSADLIATALDNPTNHFFHD